MLLTGVLILPYKKQAVFVEIVEKNLFIKMLWTIFCGFFIMQAHERYLNVALKQCIDYENPYKKRRDRIVKWEWIYLGGILLAAVLMDIKSEKIKNELICLGIVGIILKVFLGFCYEQVIESGLGFFIPIIGLFILFYFHMLGAGDIKLLAVTGGFLGIEGSLFCIVVSFLIGAVCSFIKMCICHSFTERFAYFFHYMKTIYETGERIPYYDSEIDDSRSRIHFSIGIAMSAAVYIGLQITKGM